MQQTTGDAWRDAIALCHRYPECNGSVTRGDDGTVYVSIRDPYRGLLAERLIQDAGFLLSYATEMEGRLVLFN